MKESISTDILPLIVPGTYVFLKGSQRQAQVNEINARIDKDKDRERRRQLEVQEALKKREQRRRLQSMVQMQPVELQDLEENQEQGRISD